MLVKLKKYKKRGSFLLTSILAAIVLSFIAQAIVVTATGGFGMITASRNALQAQQYATIDADALKMVDYSELDTYGPLARTAITNISESGWEHEITIGDETDIAGSDDAKQRIAKINIYKTDDTIPRFSLEVPLTSQSSGSDSSPVGTILPYVGDLDKIPKKWHLCDGTEGTPNLLDGRFLEGNITIGKFKEPALPNISGNINLERGGSNSSLVSGSGVFSTYYYDNHYNIWYWCIENLKGGVGISFNASHYSSIYKDSCDTVQPAAYTVYYIIKIKK